jgi:hypothetical protein
MNIPAPVHHGRQKSANDSTSMAAVFGGSDQSRPARQYGGGSSASMNDVFNHGNNVRKYVL